MVKITELKKAINDVLKVALPTIPLYAGDITEGFDRPSLFTKFEQMYRTDYKDGFKREITVIVYYFPENRNNYELEVLKVQEKLENAFRLSVIVKDRVVHIVDDVGSEVIDGVLQMVFDLEYYDVSDDPEEAFLKMEELIFNE